MQIILTTKLGIKVTFYKSFSIVIMDINDLQLCKIINIYRIQNDKTSEAYVQFNLY